MPEREIVLEARHLSITFSRYESAFEQGDLGVIRDLNVAVHAGEMVAVVGSSGSGKSLLAHAVLGILPYNARIGGELFYRGEPLTRGRIRSLRGREIALVPQGVGYLDPLMKVGVQVRNGRRGAAARAKARETLARYGLGAETEALYPFELSGGMARRVLISTAAMQRARLVIADEPTPGLHAEAAARVLGHFREMADGGAGVLLITHDLELMQTVADRIVVFYAGMTLEDAPVQDFAHEHTLRHPYTKALWRAMPQNGFQASPGAQPYAKDIPFGCPYAPRCEMRTAACSAEIPYTPVRDGYVRCTRPS